MNYILSKTTDCTAAGFAFTNNWFVNCCIDYTPMALLKNVSSCTASVFIKATVVVFDKVYFLYSSRLSGTAKVIFLVFL